VSVSASGVGPSESGAASASPIGAPGAYAPASDVERDLAMALDLRDIRAALSPPQGPPDWAAAQAIYLRGKNQRLPDGSIRPLAPGPGESTDADTIIGAGLARTGRTASLSDAARKAIVENAVVMLLFRGAVQQLAVARTRVETGAANPSVPVDVAWAIIAGPLENGRRPHGLLGIAAMRETDFKLDGKLTVPLEATLAAAQSAARQNDKGTFDRAFTEATGYLNAIFYLSVLRSAKVIEGDATVDARQTHLAEGWTLWQSIRATVASASADSARDVEAAFSADPARPWTAADTARVYGLMNDAAVLRALGIPTSLQVKAPPAQ
jgi:hypothetical protein